MSTFTVAAALPPFRKENNTWYTSVITKQDLDDWLVVASKTPFSNSKRNKYKGKSIFRKISGLTSFS